MRRTVRVPLVATAVETLSVGEKVPAASPKVRLAKLIEEEPAGTRTVTFWSMSTSSAAAGTRERDQFAAVNQLELVGPVQVMDSADAEMKEKIVNDRNNDAHRRTRCRNNEKTAVPFAGVLGAGTSPPDSASYAAGRPSNY
ncbi:MAG: hypothetical protein WC986_14345 [Elusimicrobiota bacterium]